MSVFVIAILLKTSLNSCSHRMFTTHFNRVMVDSLSPVDLADYHGEFSGFRILPKNTRLDYYGGGIPVSLSGRLVRTLLSKACSEKHSLFN